MLELSHKNRLPSQATQPAIFQFLKELNIHVLYKTRSLNTTQFYRVKSKNPEKKH
jgi:hypothetical protein